MDQLTKIKILIAVYNRNLNIINQLDDENSKMIHVLLKQKQRRSLLRKMIANKMLFKHIDRKVWSAVSKNE